MLGLWRVCAGGGGDRGVSGTLEFCDWTGAAEPVALPAHNGSVNSVAFSPGGQRVANAGVNATVRPSEGEVLGSIGLVLAPADERVIRELTSDNVRPFYERPRS